MTAPRSDAVEAALTKWWDQHRMVSLAYDGGLVNSSLDGLLATVTALVEAERERCAPYMAHKHECSIRLPHLQPEPHPCDCGLDAIRQAPRP